MPRTPLFRWPFAGQHLSEAEAAEEAALACLRAKSPRSPAEAAAHLAELGRHLAERARWPVQSPTEAEDA